MEQDKGSVQPAFVRRLRPALRLGAGRRGTKTEQDKGSGQQPTFVHRSEMNCPEPDRFY